MMQQLRRVKGPLLGVLAFTVLSLVLTATVAGTLGKGGGKDPNTYHAMFTDASGLRAGDDVRIAGVRVGRVVGRELDGRLARVTFTVEGAQRLPASTTATIAYKNLLGQRYIALGEGAGGGRLASGATIPASRTEPAIDLTAIFNAFKPLFETLDPADVNSLVEQVVGILQGQGGTITHLLDQTAMLTQHLAGRDRVIGQVLENMTLVMETTDAHRTEIATMVDDLGTLVNGLAADREEIGRAIGGMNELTTATAGLLGASRKPVRESIERIRVLSSTLERDRETLDRGLRMAPVMMEAYARSMSYGTWLNVYICNLSIQTTGGESLIRDRDLPLGEPEVCE